MVNVQPLADGDPRHVGDYAVSGRLGEGGQGVVYLGRGYAGPVAIKLLHPQLIGDEPARARFVREVEVTKRVARFCTAQVLSAGFASGGRPYIASEYVPGPSLQGQLRSEGPRRGAALDRLAINTVTALAAIHQAGVVHRDFKPGNVLMGPDGPVVIDFGIARALDASGTVASAVSQVVGTPAFMAPEQLAEGVIGPHTDMFAWAVTMVCAATGVPAFGHRSIPQVINRILHEEPDLGALDGRLRGAVAACLSKDPAARPTARDLMDELMGRDEPASDGAAETRAEPADPAAGDRSPFTGGPDSSMSPDQRTTRLPMAVQPSATGVPGDANTGAAGVAGTASAVQRPTGSMTGPPERRKGRTALIIAAAAAAAAGLIAGIGALAAAKDPGTDQQIAAPPSPVKHGRDPAAHRTPSPSPSRTPAPNPARGKPVRANPYTPQRLCGNGYRVVGAHPLGEARTYLLYNALIGANCVVTMVPRSTGKVFLNASLVVRGGDRQSRSGAFPFYAGPVRLPARGKCVMWGGAAKSVKWTSHWSHCGK